MTYWCKMRMSHINEDCMLAKVYGFVQERHVDFDITANAGNQPNRLQRRDTPHHLKNKRINQSSSLDTDKVAAIIANVCSFQMCS